MPQVVVLEPFATDKRDLKIGDTIDIPQERLDYLLRKKLVKLVDDSRVTIDVKSAAQSLAVLAGFFGQEISQGESVEQTLERLAGIAESGSISLPESAPATLQEAAQLQQEKGEAESGQVQIKLSFEEYLKKTLNHDIVDALITAGFKSADDIIDAEDGDLDKVPGVGKVMIDKIREATDKY